MPEFQQYQNALKVTDSSGTIRWVGHGWLGTTFDCVVGTGTTPLSVASGTDTSFGIAPGDFVKVFNTSAAVDRANGNTELQCWKNPATLTTATAGENATGQFVAKISVRPTTAAADTALLGVALTSTPVRSSATSFMDAVAVAGVGSLINCNATGTHVLGQRVIGSTTSGAVDTIAANASAITAGINTTGGYCVKINSAAQIGTGQVTQVGIIVSPW